MALPFTLTKIVNSVIWFSVVGFSITSAALAVYESPAEVLYSLTGSSITLSWIVRKTYQGFAPKVIIYAKEPSTISQTERTLVSFEDDHAKILPDGSKQSIKFSPNQLELVTSDATLPGITEELTKYSLVIKNLSDNQENTYMFNANYRVDLAKSDVGTRLIVTEPPSFVVNVTYRERIIREGTNFTENCATVGELGMSVKWIKDEFLVAKEGINSSTLTISDIDRSQDGMYSCVGTNNLTTIRRSINVSVIYPVAIETFLSSSRKSFIGQHATMRCYSEGNPKPTYSWITPNPLVNFTSSLEYGYGILHVVFTRPEDFGSYTCVASNSISSNNRSITVTQIHPPGKVSFVKNYTGVHEVFLEWSKPAKDGDSPILNYVITIIGENNHTRETNKTTIEIKNLLKNTSYGFCVQARNKVGKSKPKCIDITTLYVGPPERPVISVRLLPNNKDVEVSWKNRESATYYVVRYRKQGEEIWIEKNLTGLSQLAHELKDLTPGLTYEFQLLAGNGYGKSRPSDGRTVTIPLTTEEPGSTQRSTTANPAPEKNESKKLKTTLIAISVLIGLLLILAVVFFVLWVKRRSGRENPPAHPVEHVPGPLNGDVYAMVETAKKTSKKSKNESDLVYAELSDLSPTGDEEKPPTYVPTDYADIAQILTPDGDLTYSNVQPRCAQEGAYANVKDMGTK